MTAATTDPAAPQPRRVAHDARAIANYFLDLGERDGVPIDLVKLQHLIYFAHGWHLALYDEPLVFQTIVAQPDGPAVRDVEIAFEDYFDGYVSGRATFDPDGVRTFEPVPLRADLSARTVALLDVLWAMTKSLQSEHLIGMSTQSGDPWALVVGEKSDAEITDLPIPNHIISERFRALRSMHDHATR